MKIKKHEPNRFQIYIIDSGFNERASALLAPLIERMRKFAKNSDLYLLDEARSTRYLRKFPLLIGKDPVIVVVDQFARKEKFANGFGVHFQLGVVRNEERARWYMKILLRALNDPEASQDLASTMREAVRIEGIRGLYWTIMESFSDSLVHR